MNAKEQAAKEIEEIYAGQKPLSVPYEQYSALLEENKLLKGYIEVLEERQAD
jgi:hypothetical protein